MKLWIPNKSGFIFTLFFAQFTFKYICFQLLLSKRIFRFCEILLFAKSRFFFAQFAQFHFFYFFLNDLFPNFFYHTRKKFCDKSQWFWIFSISHFTFNFGFWGFGAPIFFLKNFPFCKFCTKPHFLFDS